jgi:hypothetical protein
MRILTILFVISIVSPVQAQLSGTVTVGSSGTYSDLSTAFADINANGVSGNLILSITGDFSEPGTTALTRSDLSAVNNVIIRPAVATTPVITVASNGIDINGASYVTLDGSNSGGTSRDLSIVRSSLASGTSLLYARGAGSTITVKNCILGDASNSPDYALRVEGPSSVVVQNNQIHGVGNSNGILYFSSVNGVANIITENTIAGDKTGSSKALGIYLAGGGGTMTISRNTLHTLRTSGGSGISGIREVMPSGSLSIVNNFVGGGFVSTSSSDYFLLDLRGASTKQIYHNTLVLNSIAGSPFDAAGFFIQDGTGDFRNNIIINNFDDFASYCIYNGLATAGDLTTDFNNLYASGSNNSVGYDGIFTYDALADWKAWTGVNPDQNSVGITVSFSNIASDFHLSGGSNGDTQLRGTDGLASVDIDGDARLTNPDGPYMGADEGSNALPVQLTTFNAIGRPHLTAELVWNTAGEVNNYGFEIERRSIGKGSESWVRAGFVPGGGTTTEPRHYSFVDKPQSAGRYGYRLKQIDHSGSFEFIGGAEVEIGVVVPEFRLDENYPNPFNPSTTISFAVEHGGHTALKVYNLLGQEVTTLFNGPAESGMLYRVDFHGDGLPSGIYIARLQSGNEQKHLRMILTK